MHEEMQQYGTCWNCMCKMFFLNDICLNNTLFLDYNVVLIYSQTFQLKPSPSLGEQFCKFNGSGGYLTCICLKTSLKDRLKSIELCPRYASGKHPPIKANHWGIISTPRKYDRKTRTLSKGYKETVPVISEFINRYHKGSYQNHLGQPITNIKFME